MIRFMKPPSSMRDEDETLSLFMAGGITGTENWQNKMTKLISLVYEDINPPLDLVVLNPRQENYENTTIAEKRQIEWEYKHLQKCSAMMFWFPSETVCPITLFELGKWIRSRFLFVGCHPDYPRKRDLLIQLGLERPDVSLVYSLEDLSDKIRWWLFNIKRYHIRDHGKNL